MPKHVFGHRSGTGTYKDVEWGEVAEVYGSPFIKNCKILGGKIFSGHLVETTVRDSPVIAGGVISYSCIEGSVVVEGSPRVWSSVLSGNSRVIEQARVISCILSDNAVVCGTGVAVAKDTAKLVLGGWDFIDRGIWTRRPTTFICKSGYIVTENIDDLVTVSCTTNTIKKWLGGAGRRYGHIVGMTKEEIDEVQGYVETIRDLKNMERI